MKNKTLTTVITGIILIIIVSAGFYFLSAQNSNDAMMQKEESAIEQETDKSMEQSGITAENEKMDSSKESSNPGASMTKDEPNDQMANDQMSGAKSQSTDYIAFDQNTFDKISDNKRVLFFYASWCPTCKPADADFVINKNRIPEDVTVIRVNYNDPDTDDTEKALANKYGVTYQHTYVQIDSDGKQVVKWNGGRLNELLANIK